MKIKQIVVDSNENPFSFARGGDEPSVKTTILGLGEDGKVYGWDLSSAEWVLAVSNLP